MTDTRSTSGNAELARKIEKAWRWEHYTSDGRFVESLSTDEQAALVAALRTPALPSGQAELTDIADEIEQSDGIALMLTGCSKQLGIRRTAIVIAALRDRSSPTPQIAPIPDYETAARALGFQQMPNGKWWVPNPLWHPSFMGRWDSAEDIFKNWGPATPQIAGDVKTEWPLAGQYGAALYPKRTAISPQAQAGEPHRLDPFPFRGTDARLFNIACIIDPSIQLSTTSESMREEALRKAKEIAMAIARKTNK